MTTTTSGSKPTYVWVQLFERASKSADDVSAAVEKLGDVTRIEVVNTDMIVDEFRKYVTKHEDFKDRVTGIKPDQVYIYADNEFKRPLRAGARLPVSTSEDNPLRIVRPASMRISNVDTETLLKGQAETLKEIQTVKTEVGRLKEGIAPEKISISRATTEKLYPLLARLGISPIPILLPVKVPKDRPEIKSFLWDDRAESQQAGEYTKWMQDNLVSKIARKHIAMTDVSQNKSFLNTPAFGLLALSISGTTDLVLYDSELRSEGERILAVIEIKKPHDGGLESSFQNQLLLQLVAAAAKSLLRPIGVLTDLNDEWIVYWIHDDEERPITEQKKEIYKTQSLSTSDALWFIERMVGSSVLDPDTSKQYSDELERIAPAATKRRKLDIIGSSIVDWTNELWEIDPFPVDMTTEEVGREKVKIVKALFSHYYPLSFNAPHLIPPVDP